MQNYPPGQQPLYPQQSGSHPGWTPQPSSQPWQQPYSQSLPPQYQPQQPPTRPPLPPKKPPFPSRLWRRYRALPGIWQIIIAVAIIGLFVGAAVATPDKPATTSQPTPAVQVQATAAPTRATTPTPQPTPTATPTIQQAIQALASSNASEQKTVATDYQASNGFVTVTITLNELLDNDAYVRAVKQNCFDEEKAFWTDKGITGLGDVEVVLQAPGTDAYGQPKTLTAGGCDLSSDTASKFNWPNLDADQAWSVYDTATLAPSLR